jgi:hypothetical protein
VSVRGRRRSSGNGSSLGRNASPKMLAWMLGIPSAFFLGLAAALLDPVRDQIVGWVYGDTIEITLPGLIETDVGQVFAIRPILTPTRLTTAAAGIIQVKYDKGHLRLHAGSESRSFGKISGSLQLDPFQFDALTATKSTIEFTISGTRGSRSLEVVSKRNADRNYITQHDFTGRWKANFCRYEFVISTVAEGPRELVGSIVARMESDQKKELRLELKGSHDTQSIDMDFGVRAAQNFELLLKLGGPNKQAETVWFEYPATIYELAEPKIGELFGNDFLNCLLDRRKNNYPINIRTGYKPSLL